MRKDLNSDIAAIWIEVGKYKNKWLICQYYRQHKVLGVNGSETSVEQNNRLDKFLNTISAIQHSNSLIIGDFNINLDDNNTMINQRNSDMKDKLLNVLPLSGFVQIIKDCTRFCSNSLPTLIDHIWISNMNKFVHSRIINTDSDHELIMATVKTKGMVKHQ